LGGKEVDVGRWKSGAFDFLTLDFSTGDSDSLRATPESFVQPRTNLFRQREQLAVTIKLDGFACGVKHRVAVVTLSEVSFEGIFQFFVQLTIEIIG
jgi:hypothetical protein